MSWVDTLHSANWNQASGIGLFAYILGCFAAGYYLVRFRLHEDVRQLGSGSVGARNVGRYLGKTGFFLTVLSDFGKGACAVWIARHFSTDERIVAFAMIAVVVGHIWPAQLRFHGGKGMATSLGALLVFDPRLAFTFAAIFLCAFALQRRTILPGLFALACLPAASFFLHYEGAKVLMISILSGLVLLAHRKNVMEEIAQLAERRHTRAESDDIL